jgi:hypothetical protein
VALFATSETFLTFYFFTRQKRFWRFKISNVKKIFGKKLKNISDVALFTTSETFLRFQNLKRQKNFRKKKLKKHF